MLCFTYQDQGNASINPFVLQKQLSLEGTKTKIK